MAELVQERVPDVAQRIATAAAAQGTAATAGRRSRRPPRRNVRQPASRCRPAAEPDLVLGHRPVPRLVLSRHLVHPGQDLTPVPTGHDPLRSLDTRVVETGPVLQDHVVDRIGARRQPELRIRQRARRSLHRSGTAVELHVHPRRARRLLLGTGVPVDSHLDPALVVGGRETRGGGQITQPHQAASQRPREGDGLLPFHLVPGSASEPAKLQQLDAVRRRHHEHQLARAGQVENRVQLLVAPVDVVQLVEAVARQVHEPPQLLLLLPIRRDEHLALAVGALGVTGVPLHVGGTRRIAIHLELGLHTRAHPVELSRSLLVGHPGQADGVSLVIADPILSGPGDRRRRGRGILRGRGSEVALGHVLARHGKVERVVALGQGALDREYGQPTGPEGHHAYGQDGQYDDHSSRVHVAAPVLCLLFAVYFPR